VELNDREIASDVMCTFKHGVEELTRAAMECSNERLRQTLRQARDDDERALHEVSRMSSANRWYLPSPPADHQDVREVRSFFTGGGRPAYGPGMGAGPGPEYRYEPPQTRW